MSFAKRHNTASRRFTFQQVADAPYIKAKELIKTAHDEKSAVRVRGAYINRGGRYGDSAALLCEGFNVNLPAHMLAEVEGILASDEDIADINAGRVGIYAYAYENRNGGESYGVRWVDMPDAPIEQEELPF